MLYRVLQYRNGIPRLWSEWTSRFMAFQQAYELAGLPFLEHGDANLSLIHSQRGVFAVQRVEE